MDEQAFLQLLDEIFELDPGTVAADSVIQEIPGWDSLSLLMLISCIDEEYGVTLGPDVIFECRTVEELISVLNNRVDGNQIAA